MSELILVCTAFALGILVALFASEPNIKLQALEQGTALCQSNGGVVKITGKDAFRKFTFTCKNSAEFTIENIPK